MNKQQKLISVAGLTGRPVLHKKGQEVGKVTDLVFRWSTGQTYPPLSGLIVKVGNRRVWIAASEVADFKRDSVTLKTAKLDLRDFAPREGEVELNRKVLDHQLVDINGARVVRASDLYVSVINGEVRLTGVDVGFAPLLRRLGPPKWRTSAPAAGSVIDWATIHSFGASPSGKGLQISGSRRELKKLRPNELADLLEDLGRDEREELLGSLEPDIAADALEEMQPDELESILRESDPKRAAEYLAKMEPDEAADALRDVDADLRHDLLELMPHASTELVEEVLSFDAHEAGGFMTTAIVEATSDKTVSQIRTMLKKDPDRDYSQLQGIVVIDAQGRLVQDVPLARLFFADNSTTIEQLLADEPIPVTVSPKASIEKAAELLIDNRRPSILVVDEQNRPLGRIVADDMVDALLPERGRFHFPRVLTK